MIAEGLKQLESMVVEGTRLRLQYETDRRRVYDEGGEEKSYPKDPKPRNLRVDTIKSLQDAVAKWGFGDQSSVWVSFKNVVAVLNDRNYAPDYRDERVTMPLEPSPFFAVLQKKEVCCQEEFVDLLRHELAGALVEPSSLLATVRNLKFARQSESSGVITNTSAAMGKSAMAEVKGMTEGSNLPEQVTVEFEAYPALAEECDSTVVVTCSLFVSATDETLQLVPLPGEMDRVMTVARTALAKALDMGDTPVLIGVP